MQTELTKFDSLKGKIASFMSPLTGLTVRDATENAAAKGALVTVKGLAQEIEAIRVATVGPLNDQVKAINARAKELTAPLDMATATIKGKMLEYTNAENARIAEERRKLEEKAAAERRAAEEKRQAEERAAREKAAAEAKRIAEERRLAAEEEAKKKRAAAAFGVEDEEAAAERKRKEAELARKQRESEERAAAEKREREERAAREDRERAARAKTDEKRLAAAAPKNTQTVWRFEIVDRLEVPMNYWSIDESKLGMAVRGGDREIPGVRIFSEQVVVARG